MRLVTNALEETRRAHEDTDQDGEEDTTSEDDNFQFALKAFLTA